MNHDTPDPTTILADVLTNTADGVFVLDGTYHCVLFNAACERITGYLAAEMLGTDCCRVDDAESTGNIRQAPTGGLCPRLHGLRGEVSAPQEPMRIRRKDGSITWVKEHYVALRDERGGLSGVIGVLRLRPAPMVQDEQRPGLSEDLPRPTRGETSATDDATRGLDQRLDDLLASVERRAILSALQRARGRRSQAARDLGISRSRLYRRMEALGIHPREEL